MERKGTTVVTAEVVARGLKKAATTAQEDQALRMRHGVRVDPAERLPAVAEADSELADELALIEMSLLRALKRRAAQAKAATPTRSPTKSKIVSALKQKKK